MKQRQDLLPSSCFSNLSSLALHIQLTFLCYPIVIFLQLKRVMLSSGGSRGKESACNAEDLCLIPGSGRSPGQGNDLPTPVFSPGAFHGRGVWRATVHGVAKNRTRLGD